MCIVTSLTRFTSETQSQVVLNQNSFDHTNKSLG